MKKIAIFTEGQSEQIFVRELLLKTCDLPRISFRCMRLRSETYQKAPFEYPNPVAQAYFLLVDVGSDEKVLSAVRDREEHMFRMGFNRILALRDMYCSEYHKRSPNVIDESVIRAFVAGALETIRSMSAPEAIRIHFSIMELEAWLLGMYHVFEKIDSRLTVGHIEGVLGFRLPDVDPQERFYRPAEDVDKIMRLVGGSYRKRRGDVERICGRMDAADFGHAMANGRCSSLKQFYEDIHASAG